LGGGGGGRSGCLINHRFLWVYESITVLILLSS
jgi:hypothetical protein